MAYRCERCGKHYNEVPSRLICTCGSRVFLKARDPKVRRLKLDVATGRFEHIPPVGVQK